MESLLDLDFDALSSDQLEMVASNLEASIGRARLMQAKLVRTIDRRQVPLGDGVRTLEEWLVGRLDINPATARSLAVVARRDSSVLDAALAEGVGFDRVSEVAASASTDLEPQLDLIGLRRKCALERRISRREEQRAFGERFLMIQPTLDATNWRLWGSLPAVAGDIVAKTIDAVADELPADPPGYPESRATRRADALVAICERGNGSDEGSSTNATVIVDARESADTNGESGAWIVGGPRVGPATLERILCDSAVSVTALAETGVPLAIGTSQTAISPRIRRFVLARDRGCTADGCSSTTRLQPHHIRRRSNQGNNDPDNLATLCWFHHHVVVHGRGFRIDPASPPLRRRFLPRYHPAGSSDPP
jgi:hypothetical protein